MYGKSDLRPAEAEWLADLSFVRTSFCKNLHAKCYINERQCIITSLNLYEFSQVNNNEMGILLDKQDDPELYRDAYDEALRIIRISEEDVTLVASNEASSKSASKSRTKATGIEKKPARSSATGKENTSARTKDEAGFSKLTIPRLAKELSISRDEVVKRLVAKGYAHSSDNKLLITAQGLSLGGEPRSGRHGDYTLWPADIDLS